MEYDEVDLELAYDILAEMTCKFARNKEILRRLHAERLEISLENTELLNKIFSDYITELAC